MSMHLQFEPHSWYMGAAVRKTQEPYEINHTPRTIWEGYYLNGMTGYIVEFAAYSLKELKKQIKEYRSKA